MSAQTAIPSSFSESRRNVQRTVYLSGLSMWAPGLTTADDWRRWADGKQRILLERSAPDIAFTAPLFRRRLSQISRMTIQTVHAVIEKEPEAPSFKQVFISLRGEIERQFTINKSLAEDSEIMPAAFSLSVFNTPIALAAIALKLKAGYTAVYPAGGDFSAAFKAAASPVLCGAEERLLLAYADEAVPEPYAALPDAKQTNGEENAPLAFAAVLDCRSQNHSLPISIDAVPTAPAQFLQMLLQEELAANAQGAAAASSGDLQCSTEKNAQ